MNWAKALKRISEYGEPTFRYNSQGNPVSCSLTHNGKTVEFLTNGEWRGDETSVTNFHVQNANDQWDSTTDYHPGRFFDTITAALVGAGWEKEIERRNGYDKGDTDRFSPLAQLIAQHHREYLSRVLKCLDEDMLERETQTRVIPGKKYTKIDIRSSGLFMVDNATGAIYGIKGYGVIHKGKRYGTLDTIDQWYWGTSHPTRINA